MALEADIQKAEVHHREMLQKKMLPNTLRGEVIKYMLPKTEKENWLQQLLILQPLRDEKIFTL